MAKLILGPEDIGYWKWAKSHACVPTALLIDDFIRIYFAPRNDAGQSIPVFVDITPETFEIIRFGDPILDLGEVGTFDDGGIMPCSVVKTEDRIFMYYVGWNPGVSVPYRNAIGLCVSDDNGVSFHRLHQGPVVGRNTHEPFFTASPEVVFDDGHWKMWYASSTGFVETANGYSPLYHIKLATSRDGIHWERPNISCISPSRPHECTARPSVLKEGNKYRMWYCHRGSFDYRDGNESYQIGYAESEDGQNWNRNDDDIGFNVGSSEHDNLMTCYPNVLRLNQTLAMFYNGNSFGKNGILAVSSEEAPN